MTNELWLLIGISYFIGIVLGIIIGYGIEKDKG